MEFMTVSAINDFLLAPFIFIVTFCFLCCQIAEPATKKTETAQSYNQGNFPSSTDTDPTKETKTTEEKTEQTIQKAQVQEIDKPEEQVQKEVQPDEPNGLERLDELNKREARKLMGALKLQQKRNGVELSLQLMKAILKREFSTEPKKVSKVMKEQLGIEAAEAKSEKQEIKIAS